MACGVELLPLVHLQVFKCRGVAMYICSCCYISTVMSSLNLRGQKIMVVIKELFGRLFENKRLNENIVIFYLFRLTFGGRFKSWIPI